jgi:glycosyltransferase involved in cell wall biosynthesis
MVSECARPNQCAWQSDAPFEVDSFRMPTISVVVPVLNRASLLGAALKSVSAQTFKDIEVIVVDDGSAEENVRSLPPSLVGRVHRLHDAQPASARARNRALSNASGALIAFLDAGSEWMPEKLATQLEYFEHYSTIGLLWTGAIGTRGGRRTLPDVPFHGFGEIFHARLNVNPQTVLVPKPAIEEVKGFRDFGDRDAEDWDLWLRLAARRPVGYVSERLVYQVPEPITDFERRYTAFKHVIEANRELAGRNCQVHGAAPQQCVSDRLRALHTEWGNNRLRAGNRSGAREQLGHALRASPWHIRTAGVYVSTFLPGHSHTTTAPASTRTSHALVRPLATRQHEPALSLIHDTVYRRFRRRLISRLHDLDDGLSRTARQRNRILFDAVSPMSFAVFRPVFERLRGDDRLEFWFTTHGDVWRPQEIFSGHAVDDRIVTASTAARMKVDAYVNTDFWDMTWLHRRTRRVHFFHGVAGKYGLDAPTDLAPTISAFDCLMFANADRRTRYIDAGLVPDDDLKAALVGYPKLDRLVDGSLDRREIVRQLALDPAVPTVIYAPTWSPYSSLNAMGEQIVEQLAAEGLQVVVKLHDRSYDRRQRGSGGIDWAARLAKYDRHPLIRTVREADGSPFMIVADAMVSDHSSIAFEYMLLDRPIVVIDRPDLIAHAGISADKVQRLRAAADVARDATEMTRAIVAGLRQPQRLSRERRRTADELFYRPGTATDRAVQLIYRLLELPALVEAPAAVESSQALAAAG